METVQTEIKAAYDKEFDAVLERLGLLDKIRGGELNCVFCENLVTLENVHGVFSKGGEFRVSCDRLPCHGKLYEESQSAR